MNETESLSRSLVVKCFHDTEQNNWSQKGQKEYWFWQVNNSTLGEAEFELSIYLTDEILSDSMKEMFALYSTSANKEVISPPLTTLMYPQQWNGMVMK